MTNIDTDGFQEFLERIGYDTIDSVGKIELAKAAFISGATYGVGLAAETLTPPEQAE